MPERREETRGCIEEGKAVREEKAWKKYKWSPRTKDKTTKEKKETEIVLSRIALDGRADAM